MAAAVRQVIASSPDAATTTGKSWVERVGTTPGAAAPTETRQRSRAEIVAEAAYGVVAQANQQDDILSLLKA